MTEAEPVPVKASCKEFMVIRGYYYRNRYGNK